MSELKTIRFPGDAEPRVIVDGAAVHFDKPQGLSPEKQAQARENIGVSEDYYITTREDMGVASILDINKEYVWGLYDALAAKHPDKVRKYEIHNNDGTFTNYAYEISTGDYSTTGSFMIYADEPDSINKPKYLLSSGMHGNEAINTLYLYRFIRDVLEGHNVPNSFREGAILHVLPVITPSGLGGTTPTNDKGVNIQQNFNWKWGERESDVKGTKPESEKETQAVVNWVTAHSKFATSPTATPAALWVDLHNSTMTTEPAIVVGCAGEEIDTAKHIFLRGINKVIPFWREDPSYPERSVAREYVLDKDKNQWVLQDVEKKLIYSYSVTFPGLGTNYGYATNVLGIPTIELEITALIGDFTDAWADTRPVQAENVAMGAEILGNALIEFHEQYFMGGVIDMTETNEKLDGLAEDMTQTNGKVDAIAEGVTATSGKVDALSASMSGNMSVIISKLDTLLGGSDEPAEPVEPAYGFRFESDSFHVAKYTEGQMTIPCSPGAKILIVEAADDDKDVNDPNSKSTYENILASTDNTEYFIYAVGQTFRQFTNGASTTPMYWGYMTTLQETGTAGKRPCTKYTTVANAQDGSGMNMGAPARMAGNYKWTAYYWNDPEQE